MFKFHLTRSLRDIVGHLILIAFPIVLIGFFNLVFSGNLGAAGREGSALSYLSVLTIGFALTFQVYGASVSFEVIGGDFFTPMRDRLSSSPTELRKIVVSTLSTGCIVSFLQTLAVVLFSTLVLKANLYSFHLILPVFALAVIFNQFLGTIVLILSKSVKTSNIILSIYGAVVPMTIGLYFPLPENTFSRLLKNYLTPLALANTAITGVLEGDNFKVLVGVGVLLILSCGLFIALRPLSRRLSV